MHKNPRPSARNTTSVLRSLPLTFDPLPGPRHVIELKEAAFSPDGEKLVAYYRVIDTETRAVLANVGLRMNAPDDQITAMTNPQDCAFVILHFLAPLGKLTGLPPPNSSGAPWYKFVNSCESHSLPLSPDENDACMQQVRFVVDFTGSYKNLSDNTFVAHYEVADSSTGSVSHFQQALASASNVSSGANQYALNCLRLLANEGHLPGLPPSFTYEVRDRVIMSQNQDQRAMAGRGTWSGSTPVTLVPLSAIAASQPAGSSSRESPPGSPHISAAQRQDSMPSIKVTITDFDFSRIDWKKLTTPQEDASTQTLSPASIAREVAASTANTRTNAPSQPTGSSSLGSLPGTPSGSPPDTPPGTPLGSPPGSPHISAAARQSRSTFMSQLPPARTQSLLR